MKCTDGLAAGAGGQAGFTAARVVPYELSPEGVHSHLPSFHSCLLYLSIISKCWVIVLQDPLHTVCFSVRGRKLDCKGIELTSNHGSCYVEESCWRDSSR